MCKTELNSTEAFEVEKYLTVGKLVDRNKVRCIEFTCVCQLMKSPLKEAVGPDPDRPPH